MSRRQKDRRQRTAAFWAAKLTAVAGDPAAEAQVTWDQLRAAVRELPRDQQDRTFKSVRAALRQQITQLPTKR
jgi:hypothetical protein